MIRTSTCGSCHDSWLANLQCLKDKILREASMVGHSECLKALIDEGASVKSKDQYGRTALILTSMQVGHSYIIRKGLIYIST